MSGSVVRRIATEHEGTEPVDYIERTRATYDALGYRAYRWVKNDDQPAWAPLTKPLSECRVGMTASGGIYRVGQVAFHFQDDTSHRSIPSDTPTDALRATHFAYDLTDARQDPNVVFPIDTLRNLRDNNTIGAIADEYQTFMGGIYSGRRVREELAPAIVAEWVRLEVDVALLVPA